MAKKYMVVLMLGIVIISALLIAIYILKSKPQYIVYDRNFAWNVEPDPGGGADILVRGARIGEIRNNIVSLIIALNRPPDDADWFTLQKDPTLVDYPQIRLLGIDQAMMRIQILNDEYLTQRMGSFGAQAYLASVTFTLTECPRIKSVQFIFKEGDHAVPGEYTRESFPDYRIVQDPRAASGS